MRHLLLFCLLLSITTSFSQSRVVTNELRLPVSTQQDIEDKMMEYTDAIDTLYPPSATLPCGQSTDSLVVYVLSASSWIFGCNNYGDIEGAQVFDIGSESVSITDVLCWIQKMGNAGNLYARVYEVDDNNTPTVLIGESDPFPNSSLPINPTVIQKAEIQFSDPVTVTGKFAVSVEWICDFPNQSACGLASTRHGCTIDSEERSWIMKSDGTWMSSQTYTNSGTGDPLLTDLYILPIVEILTGMEDKLPGSDDINIYPNPTSGKVTIQAEGIESAAVLNLNGKILLEDLDCNNEIDLSNLSKGAYLIKITSGKGVFRKKIVLE